MHGVSFSQRTGIYIQAFSALRKTGGEQIGQNKGILWVESIFAWPIAGK